MASGTEARPTDPAADPAAAAPLPWWQRAHRALMPDYNRKATAYWWFAVLLGAGLLAHALGTLYSLPRADLLLVAAGIAVAMIAALFPVRVPRSTNSFAAGEIFIFLLLLMNGPAAATVAAAGEGLIGAWRTSRRWTSRIVSPAMSAIAMSAAGSLLQAGVVALRSHALVNAGYLLLATMLGAVLYFVLNTLLVTAVPYLKRNQWPVARELFGNFGWIGLTFAGSASIASLLFMSFEQVGIGVLVAAVPIIAMLLTALHTLFRQHESDEAIRQARVASAEREAEIAARHLAELEASERRFHSAFSHASIGMALVGFDARVLQVNHALCALLGVDDESSLVDHPIGAFVVGDDAEVLDGKLAALATQRVRSFEIEVPLRHRGGREVWAAVHGSVFAEQEDEAPCLILQVQNVTARRQAEAGLQHIAFHDSLTGLPNRRRFQEQLAQALDRVKRDARHHFSLMFLDFDRFKMINDSLGHAVGDEFLVSVARRIQQQVRPHDIVARLGGDEFAILAEDMDNGRYAVGLAGRVLEALRQPVVLAGTELTTSASIGITFSSMGYESPADMLRDADTAMYKAKTAGKARYALFDSALHTQVSERMRLEADLRRALAAGALSVVYQPIVDLSTARVVSFEALARWNHPELGAVSPARFIPVAEEAGLMLQLTDFVLRTACTQLREWQLHDAQFAELSVHVNLSGQDVAHPGLVARVRAALVDAHLPAHSLTLELTENILMERIEQALPALNELRRIGVGLSVDDFGTGYSSLQHLSALPVDSLKVDRAFVAGLQGRNGEAAIVRAVLLLGESLGKRIIAEGIETAEQLEALQQMGCALGQGYLLARPLAPEVVEQMLAGLAAGSPAAIGGLRPHAGAVLH